MVTRPQSFPRSSARAVPKTGPKLSNTKLFPLSKLEPAAIWEELEHIDAAEYVKPLEDASIQHIQEATATALRMFENPMAGENPQSLEVIRTWIQRVTKDLIQKKTPKPLKEGDIITPPNCSEVYRVVSDTDSFTVVECHAEIQGLNTWFNQALEQMPEEVRNQFTLEDYGEGRKCFSLKDKKRESTFYISFSRDSVTLQSRVFSELPMLEVLLNYFREYAKNQSKSE